MLMMRPNLRRFMPGTTARMAWNAADRLIAMIASHFSTGNVSIASTCWMPALLTRTSTLPNASSASATILAMSAGLLMSAAENSTLTPKSSSIAARAFSIAAARLRDRGGVAEAVEHPVHANIGEDGGDAQSDAAGRAGDDGGEAGKIHVRGSVLR